MDHCEVRREMQIERASVLQSDELFLNRITARHSSVGCSSRVYYYRTSEGVPFQWEIQPGTPKDPPKEEVLPPLSPPPAVISLGLPKPCINEDPSKPQTSRPLWLRFWRRSKKNKSKENGGGLESDNKDDQKSEFCSSDCEFMASPSLSVRNSSSSSSSSLSFSNGIYRDSSSLRLQSPARESLRRPTVSCSPWNVTATLVTIARRV